MICWYLIFVINAVIFTHQSYFFTSFFQWKIIIAKLYIYLITTNFILHWKVDITTHSWSPVLALCIFSLNNPISPHQPLSLKSLHTSLSLLKITHTNQYHYQKRGVEDNKKQEIYHLNRWWTSKRQSCALDCPVVESPLKTAGKRGFSDLKLNLISDESPTDVKININSPSKQNNLLPRNNDWVKPPAKTHNIYICGYIQGTGRGLATGEILCMIWSEADGGYVNSRVIWSDLT